MVSVNDSHKDVELRIAFPDKGIKTVIATWRLWRNYKCGRLEMDRECKNGRLRAELRYHNYQYAVLDNPSISGAI